MPSRKPKKTKTGPPPPSLTKVKADVVIYMTIEADAGATKEEIEEVARSAIRNAASSVTTTMRGDRKVVTNVGGESLLDRQERLEEKEGKWEAEIQALTSKVEKHEAAFQVLLDVRERVTLTWLRNFRRDHGAGSRNTLNSKIQQSNRPTFHRGYAIVDALMLKEKGLLHSTAWNPTRSRT